MLEDKRLTVTVWRDLGQGVLMRHVYWRSQVTPMEHYSHDMRFDYEYGSVRRMYESGVVLPNFERILWR